MANKVVKSIALFQGVVEETQNVLVLCSIEANDYEYVVFAREGSEIKFLSLSQYGSKILERRDVFDLMKDFLGAKRYSQEINGELIEGGKIKSPKSIRIAEKIDNKICQIYKDRFAPLSLAAKDFGAEPKTLGDYIKDTFSIESDTYTRLLKEEVEAGHSTSIPFAFKKDQTDYSKTIEYFKNSPEKLKLLGIGEKPNFEICKTNESRECAQIAEKILTTSYPGKRFTAIGLSGNPGQGKTEFVKEWCRLNSIPFLTVVLDNTSTLRKVLKATEPVRSKGNPIEEDGKGAPIVKLMTKLYNELIVKTARLSTEESIWLEAFKNDLPLIVFVDEANTATSEFFNQLSPMMSDGVASTGVDNYKNIGNTIKYVFAWNPNTSKGCNFDKKFWDRLYPICFDDLSKEQRMEVVKKQHDREFGYSEAVVPEESVLNWGKASKRNGLGLDSGTIDEVVKKVIEAELSEETARWYYDHLIKEKCNLGKNLSSRFSKKEFVPFYFEDVSVNNSHRHEVEEKVYDLIQHVNATVAQLTKGADLKNKDRSFYYDIGSRNYDIVIDMIMCYGSVERAISRIIKDLIPTGHTMNPTGVVVDRSNPAVDNAPDAIAKAVVDANIKEIDKLQELLFNYISTDEQNEIAKFRKEVGDVCVVDRRLWGNAFLNESVTEEEKRDSIYADMGL